MKKCLLLATLVAFTVVAGAQTKGQSTVGLGFNTFKYSTSNNSYEDKSTNFTLSYGLFVKENARLGLDLGFSKSDYSYNSPFTASSNTTSLGLNYKQFHPIAGKFYWTLSEAVSYGWGDREENSGGTITNYKNETFSAGASAGLSYFLSKRFMIEADGLGLSYYSNKSKATTNVTKNSQFQVSNYLNLRVNFTF